MAKIKVAFMQDLLSEFSREEISFSRMVELINEQLETEETKSTVGMRILKSLPFKAQLTMDAREKELFILEIDKILIESIQKVASPKETFPTDDEVNKKIFEICTRMRQWDGKSNTPSVPELMVEFSKWIYDRCKITLPSESEINAYAETYPNYLHVRNFDRGMKQGIKNGANWVKEYANKPVSNPAGNEFIEGLLSKIDKQLERVQSLPVEKDPKSNEPRN